MVKQSRKRISLQTGMALFAATPILSFCGQPIIQSRKAAISEAIELSDY